MCPMRSFMAIFMNKFSVSSRPVLLILPGQMLSVCLISPFMGSGRRRALGLIASLHSPAALASHRRDPTPRCLSCGVARTLHTCFCTLMIWYSLAQARRFCNTSSTRSVLSSQSKILVNSDSSWASMSDAHQLASSCHSSGMLKMSLIAPV